MNHSVFRDLVPSYIENLTSEETNNEIEKHMEQCEDCRQYVKEMQEDLLVEHTDEKKRRRKVSTILKRYDQKTEKRFSLL